MKAQIADSIGASVLVLVGTLPLGCLPHMRDDLQPLVAASGAYGLVSAQEPPPPAPGVCRTCRGKGVVGDGVVEVPCPDCQPAAQKPQVCDCGCEGRGYVVRSDGSRWACKCPPGCSCKSGCKDGKCQIPRAAP